MCGGIAAYKSAELVRLLRKQGAEVRVVLTASALQFVTPLTFQALSSNPVHSELLDAEQEKAMGHINLARWADVLVVAPATANMIAKFSHGLADDLLSTLYLAAQCPVYIAPAMNQAMWRKAVTQDNIQRLQACGNTLLGPAQGEQACGETGPGRMLEAADICRVVMSQHRASLLVGTSVLISAGPTREALDPVRYISNRSSGKMGYAIARAVIEAGGNATLVSGPVALTPPEKVDLINVETAEEMYQKVMSRAAIHDIFIGAAAVADYTPLIVETEKIKKSSSELLIKLAKTKDILAEVAALENKPYTVGFAAETHDLDKFALAKLNAKKIDMIAANWVGKDTGGFESELNALSVFWHGGRRELSLSDKTSLAGTLLELIAEKFNEKRTTKDS